jgi:NAD-dependent SIR2 family protein deacetylase
MRTVLFAGAGVSAELGVPAMRSMAEAFRDHLRDNSYPSELVGSLERLLAASDFDMEGVIDDLDSASRGAAAGARWGLSGIPEVAGLESLRAEAEWLISHLCERVDARRASWLWGSALRGTAATGLTIVTTNYDRAIEQAALQSQTPISDGFPDFEDAELVAWAGFDTATGLKVLKIHGSTDWYHEAESQAVWKLRHAMPLYGGVRVSTAASDVQLKSASVLPSREKIVTSPPYPALQYEFRKSVEASDIFVLLGSSLRDPDLRDIAAWSSTRRPTLIIGRSVGGDLPGTQIQMSASRFLISVLPRLMTAGTADEGQAIAELEAGRTAPILDAYLGAFESARRSALRCVSIEGLAAERVSLSGAEVSSLLNDAAGDVATYALGLIGDSPAAATLTAAALARAEADDASSFAREARLLQEVSQAPDTSAVPGA